MKWRSLAFVGLLLACTSSSPDVASSDGASAIAKRLVPRWRTGDWWVVRYKGKVDMGFARREDPLVMWEYEWHYRVTSIDDDGVHVTARTVFPPGHEREATMTFAPEGRLITAEYGSEIEKGELGGAYYFPLFPQRYSPVAFEWPAFPLTEGGERPSLDGATEKVEHTGTTWRVEMRRQGKFPHGEGVHRENTMEQLWEVDRPWWTSLTIRFHIEKPGYVTDDVDVEGRVTEWHLVE